jgi:two-component system chemotaxis sensor kinase CheA
VSIGHDYFVVPLSVVTECVELTREDLARGHGHKFARVRDEIVPYVHLRERFEIEGEAPAIEQIVITEMNGSRIGLVVDQVIGEQQTVIKSLSRVYRSVAGISGATLLGDGTVALILDPPQLVQGQAAELLN